MEKWFVMNKKADFNELAGKLQISPILARILRNRDLMDEKQMESFLHGGLQDCHSPQLLLGMDRAVDRLVKAVTTGESIRVMGDYDVDGICSTFILLEGLKKLGARVDAVIPHRIHDGYGLNDNMIEEAKSAGIQLILTCDNGISAAQPIHLAGELGMEVIVTDHHEVPYRMEGEEKIELLPEAMAVIDPKQKEDTYPFKEICGAVVAYKLICALYDRWKTLQPQAFEKQGCEDTLQALLEPAALATVCDVMELKDENRIYVKEGLKQMRNPSNLGLRCLLEVNGIQPEKINAFHFGFVIGPCLNATGRLDSAARALELLCLKDKKEAMEQATWLKELNDSRKNKTAQGEQQAIQVIEENHMQQDKVLVVYLKDVHESLAGIIAGRIRERYVRPTFILTDAEEGLKGSGRSIPAYHMYEGLVEAGDLLTKFGGHKLAAGLSLPYENLDEFRRRLNENCKLSEEDFYEKVSIDIPMPLSYSSLELARELEILEPFGVGNPKPLFAEKDVVLVSARYLGKQKNFLKVMTQNREELVYFGNPEKLFACLREKYGQSAPDNLLRGEAQYPISVVYTLSVNSYLGRESKQYELKFFS